MAKDRTKDKELLEAIGKDLVDLMREAVFTIDGMPMVSVKRSDGQYRRKAMVAGAEFMLDDTYVGAKGTLILCFTPVDAQDYVQIEVGPNEVDSVMADFGIELGKRRGSEEENTKTMFAEMVKDHRRRAKEDEKAAERSEKSRLAATYEANPLYGRF